jgi:hypothetical protein
MRNALCLAAALLLAAALYGCGSSGPDPYVTEILDVRVEPNPVVVGDTATFTCVIADSTEPGFTYSWFLEGTGGAINTDISKLTWIAPKDTGAYDHIVKVKNHETNLTSTQSSFTVSVISSR